VRDLVHTECQLLVTDSISLPLLHGATVGPSIGTVDADSDRVLVLDSPAAQSALAAFGDVAAADVVDPTVTPQTLGYLLFTSGTSGAPKACRCTQGRLARIGAVLTERYGLSAQDVCYLAMPLFHSNALMAGWSPALIASATFALPTSGRFSASGFLPDVRASGVTYFNYVGKPLSYILATPERPDDADNPLRYVFGNEGSADDVARFAARFGVPVTDAYGSTEGGATVQHTPDTPSGALGRAPEGTVVLDAVTGEECPPARFDAQGRLLNADVAIGELVSKAGSADFEGYWHNDDAEAARLRHGWYWTGDLAYRDEAGFFYFAGRDHDWLRVDGENFASAPIERILQRHPDVILSAVYAVPDPLVGDQVMAAVQLRPGVPDIDGRALTAFLAAQADLGTKWAPRFVRVTPALPMTATNKVLKRALRAERWNCADPVLWQPHSGAPYQQLGESEARALEAVVGDRVL
jgi:fatty-acyl-CoA synthase